MKLTCRILSFFQKKGHSHHAQNSIVFLFFIFFLLCGCTYTKSINRTESLQITPYYIEQNITFPEISEPYKYIFIRFYNPVYKNPFDIGNTLQRLIRFTEVSDYNSSHCAIGFSLDDSFYGITTFENNELAIEHCSCTSDNEYMDKCESVNSEQLTVAIKVRESEYLELKKYVEDCAYNPLIKYDTKINFKIVPISIKRKFFSKEKNKEFGNVIYPSKEDTKPSHKKNDKETFVCSTFVSHCLVEFVPEIRKWFKENNQNDELITVTDLLYLPYVTKLFYSYWDNYELAATTFVEKYPEFLSYLNN